MELSNFSKFESPWWGLLPSTSPSLIHSTKFRCVVCIMGVTYLVTDTRRQKVRNRLRRRDSLDQCFLNPLRGRESISRSNMSNTSNKSNTFGNFLTANNCYHGNYSKLDLIKFKTKVFKELPTSSYSFVWFNSEQIYLSTNQILFDILPHILVGW